VGVEMRGCWAAILFPLAAVSQGPPPATVVRGVLLDRGAFEFSIRAPDSRVLRFQFDHQLYVERGHEIIDIARLDLGEQVEVISEKIDGSTLRFALTVHAKPPAPPPHPPAAGQKLPPLPVQDRPLPYGSFPVTGVIFRIDPGAISLHTRTGEQSLMLRSDTRFMQDGDIVGPSALKLNMHVFVRAGKTVYGELEAYQVLWGGIRRP
jgi:hypothetical protein